MENESRLAQWLTQTGEKIAEQEWFRELKTKWDELDPQHQLYAKIGAVAGGILFAIIYVLGSMWSLHSLKNDLADKSDLVTYLDNAYDEVRRQREASTAGSATAGTGPWNAYLEQVAASAGVDKTALEVGAEKPGQASDLSKEALIDVTLKHVSIKQVVRYAFQLENGGRPVKVRTLSIDTQGDPAGYMNATISISGFTIKQEES